MPQKPIYNVAVSGEEKPRIAEDPEAYYKKIPSWRFSRADTEHPEWSVMEVHPYILTDPEDPTGSRIEHEFSKSIDKALLDGLSNKESMTWGAILTQTGGRGRNGGTNSHPIAIKDLCKDAQLRATELDLQVDELVSVRVDAKKRIFGILENGVFNVIWFDREHKIAEVTKR